MESFAFAFAFALGCERLAWRIFSSWRIWRRHTGDRGVKGMDMWLCMVLLLCFDLLLDSRA